MDIKFLYRLKLNQATFDKIRQENDLKVDSDKLIPYIKKFIRDLKSGKQWLECSITKTHSTLQFIQETELAARCMLKLPFTVVRDEEFIDYIIANYEKYRKKSREIREDNERKKGKIESLEKEIKSLKLVDDKNKDLERKLEDLRDELHSVQLDLEVGKISALT